MNVLLLVGSPKQRASASRSFGNALMTRLAARGAQTREARVTPSFQSPDAMRRLLDDIAWSDLVVLSFPLYVDALPAPVVRMFEAWADAAATADSPLRSTRLAALTQCGFPETRHCAPALDICRSFCRETGVSWAGGLAFGMGGAIDGRPVEKSPLARALPAFDEAADALMAGRQIPASAVELVGRRLVPNWVYVWFGGIGWWWLARRRGAREPLRLRRYAQ